MKSMVSIILVLASASFAFAETDLFFDKVKSDYDCHYIVNNPKMPNLYSYRSFFLSKEWYSLVEMTCSRKPNGDKEWVETIESLHVLCKMEKSMPPLKASDCLEQALTYSTSGGYIPKGE